MIYSLLNRDTATRLHEEGYVLGKRHFKLFSFSRLFGTRQVFGGYVVFVSPVLFYVTSSDEEFINELCSNALKAKNVMLEVNTLRVSEVSVLPDPEVVTRMVMNTMSPITVYSTVYTADGKRKTYYYSPYEPDFSHLISENLKKKHLLITGQEINGEVSLEPLRVREVIGMFKRTIIKGWIGKFRVCGPVELLKIGYDTGFGPKNSIGYGMVEIEPQ
nr:CRISPR-associated endoribonuclease Cas6 [Ferrimicrobium acidiphilum]